MGFGRKLASVTSAVVLAGASLVALGQSAHAAAQITATSVDVGQATTITIGGCGDATQYTGAVLQFADSEGTIGSPVNVATAGKASTTYTWTAPEAGAYAVRVTCLGYAGTEDSVATANFLAFPTSLYIDPSSWSAGDTVTLTAYGFQPGEKVSLAMLDKSTGTSVWSAAAVATADENGTFTYDIVLESDVPLGTYLLVATGDQSSIERSAEFYWGSPDADDDGDDDNPGGGGGDNGQPTLPDTGA